MGNLELFLKGNKKKKETTTFPATASLCDENGKPVEWTIRAVTTAENDAIRDECTTEVPIPGKPGMYRQRLDNAEYTARLICAAVVEPDLNNAVLQDSYGVLNPVDLLKAMVDNPSEYNALGMFVLQYNGTKDINALVGEAKND